MGQEDRKTTEAAKVRLVRCPKCENLLPELPDFPLYQCGGCGAVLKAKKKGILEERLPEKTNDVKGPRISDDGSIVHISEVEIEKENGTELGTAERSHKEKVSSDGSSTLRVENGEAKSDCETSKQEREKMVIMESKNDDYGSYGLGLVSDIGQGRDRDLNTNGLEYTNYNGEQAVKEMRPPLESLRSKPLPIEELDVAASLGPVEGVVAQGRFNDHPYHGEGPSSNGMNSYYEYGGRTRYHDPDFDGRARVKNLENDRAELLRKLDELKDQISRSCDVADRHKEKMVPDRRMVSPTVSDHYGRYHAAYVQEGLTNSHGLDKKPLSPYDLESPYLGHVAGFNPCSDRYSSSGRESRPQRGFPNDLLARGDTYQQDMLRGRWTFQSESQYMYPPYNKQFPHYYADANHDQSMLHSHQNFFHQPACSCVICYNKNLHLPPKIDSLTFRNQRSQNEPSNLNFHGSINPTPKGLPGYNFGGSGLHQLNSQQSLHMNSSDVDPENIRSNYHHARKMAVSHRSGRVCRSIAGGAPFITCCNCFELLKLPRKCISSEKLLHKMKCGACSSIISFEVGSNGGIGSVSVHVDQFPNEIDEGSSGTVDENVIYWPGDTNSADLNCDSNDYNDLRGKFSPIDKKSNSGESEKQQDPLSSTLCHKNEQSPENITSRKHDSSDMVSHLTEVKSSLNLELPPKEWPDHFPDTKVIGQPDVGNRSRRSEHETIAFGGTNFRPNSATEAIVATEMDVSLNEFPNSCVSQDSVETSKEDHRKVHKGGEFFFAGLIKKSFRDLTKSNQSVLDGGALVFVNGHVILDHMVKKAEKLAGPIQPGEYWYDIRAGFWGVMGHPCLGITMPNIEEFNYPMPKNCAAGNTGVFVNGRELNQKDLDLLSSRGLPITRQRSYNIEISGKVIDEHTGEELDLGKLAPTVERAKHGFGMKVPRYLG